MAPDTLSSAAHRANNAVAIAPDDSHNRILVGNVHPPEWRNPTPEGRYDLVVIGAGTGGLVSAAIAASLKARVALVERHLLGGDCLNVGCVPSKALIRAARSWAEARASAERFGGPRVEEGSARFSEVMERMRRIRAEISHHDAAARFRDEYGVDVHLGGGRFTGRDALEVGGATLRFRRAIIATGARAAAPPIEGLEEAGYLTNETLFELTELPPRLGIIGGGPIGTEMAQAFARLGSEVTLLDMADRILVLDDTDAANVVLAALKRDGIRFEGGTSIERVTGDGAIRTVHYTKDGEGRTLEVDRLLVAAGRQPNVDGLGLEMAGVEFDERKGVFVNSRLQTSNSSIFAVGDVVPGLKLTHRSDSHARIAVPNALFFGRSKADSLVVPWCIYTSPELAHVGISGEEAAERGDEVDAITVPFSEVDRARLDGSEEGFLRVYLKRGKDTILGATLVGEHAGEIISQITAAMTAGIGLSQLGDTIFPYPTRAEIVRKAADLRRRERLTRTAEKALGMYWRIRH
jgi:pyruvate/2-oxoglutarate dehydrogenase complex dihydrolipoamide dehydrogenase (E3) component